MKQEGNVDPALKPDI